MKESQKRIGLAPQVHLSPTTADRTWLIALCALAPILQSSLSDGFSSLFVAVVAVSAALASELIIDADAGRFSLGDGSAVASALVLALLMPNTINPIIPAVASIFAVVVVKHSFGGLGANWLNPAVGAWLFARVSWPASFSAALDSSPLDMLESSVSKGLVDPSGSPLAVLKIGGYKPSVFDGSLTDKLNSSVLGSLGVELPGGYFDFFSHTDPGIIADRGFGALLFATMVLAASRSARVFIPAVFLGVYTVLVRIGGGLPYGGTVGAGDMLFSIMTGGTVLSAFVLAADPSTGTKSNMGAVCAAALAGMLSFALRFPGAEPYGAAISIAFVNAVVPIIRRIERRFLYMAWRKA